jgi:hypothetical protein
MGALVRILIAGVGNIQAAVIVALIVVMRGELDLEVMAGMTMVQAEARCGAWGSGISSVDSRRPSRASKAKVCTAPSGGLVVTVIDWALGTRPCWGATRNRGGTPSSNTLRPTAPWPLSIQRTSLDRTHGRDGGRARYERRSALAVSQTSSTRQP